MFKEIKLKEFPNINFCIARFNNKLTLSEDKINISFKLGEHYYGAIIPKYIECKPFGKIDLSLLSDREIIIGCLFATISRNAYGLSLNEENKK